MLLTKAKLASERQLSPNVEIFNNRSGIMVKKDGPEEEGLYDHVTSCDGLLQERVLKDQRCP